jgi:hypothetical protein
MLVMTGHAWTATLTTGSQRQALLRLYVQGSTCYKLETHRMSLLATFFFDTSLPATCASLCSVQTSLSLYPLDFYQASILPVISMVFYHVTGSIYIWLSYIHQKIYSSASMCDRRMAPQLLLFIVRRHLVKNQGHVGFCMISTSCC